MSRLGYRLRHSLATVALASAALAITSAPAAAGTATITSGADNGPGSLRAAVAAANADPSITTISFAPDLTVELASEVRFTGSQDLRIDGRNSTVSGATAAPDTDTWDSGLLVATGGGDLSISQLIFADSFNNGLAVFVPTGGDDVAITLDRVTVRDAQFHGVLIDAQASSGYNTDDVIHPECTDPYAVDAGVSIDIVVTKTSITGAGVLDGFDTSLATGCPQDFDGLRVDQGGAGDITGTIVKSTFDGNLADGAELDEKGAGSVIVDVAKSTFDHNGDTVEIECTAGIDGCVEGDLIADLDDGFDIDEEGPGDLIASMSKTTANGNFDEGLDFDEAGDGDIEVEVIGVTAIGNNDEAFKASEEDAGDVEVEIDKSMFVDGGDDGTQIEEEGDGDIEVEIAKSTVTGNGKFGVKVEQSDAGEGELEIDKSDLRGNDDGAVETEGVDDIEVTKTQV